MVRDLSDAPDLDVETFLRVVKLAEWRENLEKVDEALAWKCFYCRRHTSSKGLGRRLLVTNPESTKQTHLAWLVICSYCNMPTLLDSQNRPLFEATDIPSVPNLPMDVELVFSEALKALSVGCNSSAILLCRKLIMHLAFELGREHFSSLTAERNGYTPRFVEYVQWLASNHHIPPTGKKWVDEVVSRGNDENHQLVIATHEEALRIVKTTRLLLAVTYEFQESVDATNGSS